MAKGAMIGAGSLVFAKTLMEDFLGTLKEIRDMTSEMLEAQRPVPTEPALAIANRFGKLAEVKA